jgi:signal transduction histidine kinase
MFACIDITRLGCGGDAPHPYEFQGVRKDGSAIWVETLARLVNWQGEPATQAAVVDITARKRAEAQREQLQAQLLQAQKLEAIGTLAGGIAHDFNNILGSILGYSELALEDVPRESGVRRYLQEVVTAGKRARDLVRQILTFSRKAEQLRQPIQLHLIVKKALKPLRASLPATIDIRQWLDATASTVLADPTQMHQVLMNLCTNAEYAMRETGAVLEVRLEAAEVTADFAMAHPPLSPGPHVRLTVPDSGHGMESEILEHIEVWHIRPALPIILCTGSSHTITQEKAEALGIRAYLLKPVMQQDLALAIRQVLDQRNT